MEKVLLSVILLTILLWMACHTQKNQAPEEEPTPSTTEATEEDQRWNQGLHDIWVLTNLNGKELEIGSPRPQIELFPEEGRLGGQGCCNRLFGKMKAQARSITFSEIGTTKMHCGEYMERETEFVKELARAERYLVREGELLIFWGDLLTLSFRKVD